VGVVVERGGGGGSPIFSHFPLINRRKSTNLAADQHRNEGHAVGGSVSLRLVLQRGRRTEKKKELTLTTRAAPGVAP